MASQTKNPVERCNADGVQEAESKTKGNYPMNDTAFDAGRKQAANWFTQNGYSLCVYRDLRRAEHCSTQKDASAEVCRSFDAGFSAGLADFIGGVRHG